MTRPTRIVGLLLAGGAALGTSGPPDYTFFDPLIDLRAAILQRYAAEVDEASLQRGAISGMLEALGDEYTLFVPPASEEEFRRDLLGEFVGVGALVALRDGRLTIVTPLDDSPALAAGLRADDVITSIDATPTAGLSQERCSELLSGRPGSTVSLGVERGTESLTLAIVRERITTQTVKGFERDPSGRWRHVIDPAHAIGYLRLTQFTPTSAREVEDAIEAMRAEVRSAGGLDLGGLILDLRWNPGGVMREAEAIADLFLREGVIVTTRGRAVDERVARAREEGTLPDFPLLVLVDGHSASASEVVAGALAEHGRAVILGERTFGKGVVQAIHALPRGRGQLKITEARYHLASGRCLHREDDSSDWGVDPTPGFFVPMSEDENIEMRRTRQRADVIRPVEAGEARAWSDPEWIRATLRDPRLAAGLVALRARIVGGGWTPVGETTGEDGWDPAARNELSSLRLARERLARERERVERRIDALERARGPASDAEGFDLWSDEASIVGGRVEVFDAEGNPVATLDIGEGQNLERWLIDAGVRPRRAP